MGAISAPSRTLCPTLNYWKWGYLAFDRKRLEPEEFSWQRRNGCHLVLFVMYISIAKFEEHCFNIFRDILYSVKYSSCKPHEVITFLIFINTKTSLSQKQKKTRHFSVFFKAFQISSNYFSCQIHFNNYYLILWLERSERAGLFSVKVAY